MTFVLINYIVRIWCNNFVMKMVWFLYLWVMGWLAQPTSQRPEVPPTPTPL